MTSPSRVLLVNYAFPPAGGSGVQRMLGLARYLPRFDGQPLVLCCGHDRHPLRDDSLLDALPDNTPIIRTHGWEPAGLVPSIFPRFAQNRWNLDDRLVWRGQTLVEHVGLPEPALLWALPAANRARRIVRQHAVDVVVTSGPPHSAHLVGLSLKRRLGLPWVADLRDPIVSNFSYAPPHRAADRFWRWLETQIVRHADQIVVTCPAAGDDLARRRPCARFAPGRRLTTITNGYDPADFPAVGPALRRDRFTLACVGAFYRQQSLAPILAGIRRLIAARPDVAPRFRFEHVGTLARSQEGEIMPTDSAWLIRAGYLPHPQAITKMLDADALLLTAPPTPGGRLCIPSKTFEYLAARRHIVALVPPATDLAALLQAAGGATLVHDYSPAAVADALTGVVDRWRKAALPADRDPALLHATRRDVLAGRYAELLARSSARRARPATIAV